MTGEAALVAVDWGTSHLRVWLLDAAGRVVAERRSDDGMMSAARAGFSGILEGHLATMGVHAALPAIVCGMAGSRQGWMEAPYVTAPASFSEILDRSVVVADSRRPVRIVPGVAQRDAEAPEVMRGEETQLAGIPALAGGGRALVCLPGTHSKWITVAEGSIGRFTTWLTGEMFALLSSRSILSHSVGEAAPVSPRHPEFHAGVEASLSDPAGLTARLFRIRAATLLDGMTADAGAARLSGLLIGAEIAAATRQFGDQSVMLVASGQLAELYAAALRLAGHAAEAVDADAAVRGGLFRAAGRLGMLDPARARA